MLYNPMKDGSNNATDSGQSRRRFLGRTGGLAAVTASVALAGCSGGGQEEGIHIPGLYDLSGATADVGRPTGLGCRDAINWLDENGELEEDIVHDWYDYAYQVPEAQQQYDEWTQSDAPPVILGWGTADTEALANDVAFDEIVYISASASDDLLSEETPYNFYPNLDYTSQVRAHLDWIAEQDSDATVLFMHPTVPFGETVLPGGEAYAEELGLNLEGSIALELDANDASTQVQRAQENDVDYIIHHSTAAPMQVLLNAVNTRDADITVMGTTWTTDELRVQESPNLFEGVRYVNANMTFGEAMDSEAEGWQIIEESFEREDRDPENPDVANLNYVRGVVHTLLAYEGILQAQEMDNDPNSGSNIREAIFELEEFDGWGLVPEPMNWQDGDRRATMSAQMYEVQDGEMVNDGSIELERRDGWIPPYEWE